MTAAGLQGHDPDPLRDPLKSDADMATVAADDALTGVCWAGSLGWLRYAERSGTWLPVAEEIIAERVRKWMLIMRAVCLQRAAEAARAGRPTDALEGMAAAWAVRSSASRIFAVTRLCRGVCYVDPSRFDAHPDLLNCPNGVVDLQTGELRLHDRNLLLTKVTTARYVPGATSPDWTKALEAIPADARD